LSSPKLLFVDIETAPLVMAAWTQFEANAIWIERDTFILSFAARWGHQKRTKTYALPDYPSYRRDKHNDKSLCAELFDHLDQADVVIAHNGDAFDIKKINSRLIVNGFKPPAPYKTVDTLKIARRVFKFDSNKLDNIGRYLNRGRKLTHTGADLWRRCVAGDPKAWAKMRRYNARDVDLLVDVYNDIKVWAPNHPDLRLYDNRPGCPVCRSNRVIRRGFNIAMKRKTERLQCSDCSHWFTGQVIKAEAA
jgi:DNA polymerase elongation subunit (family B)